MDKTPQIEQKAENASKRICELLDAVGSVVVGQRDLLKSLVIGILCEGHILLEGIPGLGKSLIVQTLAKSIDANFCRIQFTPDLLPADLIGTEVFNPKDSEFHIKKGPVFANIVLADEINRAPPKVQSALLEAMQERQITISGQTMTLETPFTVLATQNPVEHEGVYPLPEAQVDRFFMKTNISFPSKEEEMKIIKRMAATGKDIKVDPVMETKELIELISLVNGVYADEKIERYAVDIVFATRDPASVGLDKFTPMIQYGASPRASIALILASKAAALISGRSYVTPKDIKRIGQDVLRHRIHLTYEAEAEEISADLIVNGIFDSIEVP